MDNNTIKKNPKTVKPNDLGNLFGWIISTILVIVISIKVLISDFDFSQLRFEFTDLLSIIIALFAVWISINFYHKNNETSNKFYNNTYNFTKDISETLGRIEERFGEKLESLKEENRSLSNRVEKYYSTQKPADIAKDEKKEKEIQAKLEQELKEKDKLLNNFAQKYKIAEQDKNQFIETLNKKSEEVAKLENRLKLFEKSNLHINEKYNIPSRIVSYTKSQFKNNVEFRNLFYNLDVIGKDGLKEYFLDYSERMSKGYLRDLEKYEIVDENRGLTDFGLNFMFNIANELK